ncbi:MAG: hypothetical protein FWD69_10680 [Polyangiaceae bacterium]|nr:hypothetical protein [Polyangiaceae bacterium]
MTDLGHLGFLPSKRMADSEKGKSFGKTVLGWFVVDENEATKPENTPEELIAKYAAADIPKEPETPFLKKPEAPVSAVPKLNGDIPKAAAGVVDFTAVYRAASVGDAEQERVAKALSLVDSLPSETPRDVKKQIVEASLKAFSIPIEQIIETGAQEIQALEAYIQHGQADTQSVLAESNARIEELSAEIGELKKIMEQQVTEQQALVRTCNNEKLRVQVVLEFFGQAAVERVVKESPKLVEPMAK